MKADPNTGVTQPLVYRLVYVEGGNKVADLSKSPQNSILKMEEAKNSFKNMPMAKVGNSHVLAITDWLSDPDRKTARGTGFRPGAGRLFENQGENWVNTFHMPDWPEPENDDKISIIFNQLRLLIPNAKERDTFIQWMAATVHKPELRSGFTPLSICHTQGIGRGWLASLLLKLLGEWNCSKTKMKTLAGVTGDGQYHNYLHNTLFCSIAEVKVGEGRYDIDDEVRDKLTDSPLSLNLKFGENGSFDIYTNFFMASNSRDALVISKEDRRIFVIESNEPKPEESYYKKLLYPALQDLDFLAQVYHWLKEKQDADYYVQQVAPMTGAKRAMINMAKSDLQELFDQMVSDEGAVSDVVSSATFRGFAEGHGYQYVDEDQKHINNIFRRQAYQLFEGKKRRIDGTQPIKFYAIRNANKWSKADDEEIKREFKKY